MLEVRSLGSYIDAIGKTSTALHTPPLSQGCTRMVFNLLDQLPDDSVFLSALSDEYKIHYSF